MYAPKFRFWLTDQERFSEALDYKLTLMADAALKEIRDMTETATLKEPKKEKTLEQIEQESRNAWMNAMLQNTALQQSPNWLANDPYAQIQIGGAPAGYGLRDCLGFGIQTPFGW